MKIAGSYDDIQGGICYGPIAHAGPPRYHPVAWFNTTCKISYINPIQALSAWTLLAKVYPTKIRDRFFSSRTAFGGIDCHVPITAILQLSSIDDGGQALSVPIVFSTLYTAAWIYTGTQGTVNVNGVGGYPKAMSISGMLATLDLGYYQQSSFALEGTLFDIIIFSRALSAAEMLAPYQVQDSRIFAVPGHGITAADWTDTVGGLTPTITGLLTLRYVRGDGVIITP